jgi:hypothetical protein
MEDKMGIAILLKTIILCIALLMNCYGCAGERPMKIRHIYMHNDREFAMQFAENRDKNAIVGDSQTIGIRKVDGKLHTSRRLPYKEDTVAQVSFAEVDPGLHSFDVFFTKPTTKIVKHKVVDVMYNSTKDCFIKAPLEAGHVYMIYGWMEGVGYVNNEEVFDWHTRMHDETVDQELETECVFDKNVDIYSIRGRVVKLLLCEGPLEGFPPDDQIHYSLKFPQPEVRSIWWQLYIDHPAPTKPTEFKLQTVWIGPDNKVFYEKELLFTTHSGWTNSKYWSNCGFNQKGKWKPGTYVLNFYEGKTKVAELPFVID